MIEYLLAYLLILLSIVSTVVVLQLFFICYIEIKDYFKNP